MNGNTLTDDNRKCLELVEQEMSRRFKASWKMNLVVSPSHVIQHYSTSISNEEHWYHLIVNTITGKVQMFKRQEEWLLGDPIVVNYKRHLKARHGKVLMA